MPHPTSSTSPLELPAAASTAMAGGGRLMSTAASSSRPPRPRQRELAVNGGAWLKIDGCVVDWSAATPRGSQSDIRCGAPTCGQRSDERLGLAEMYRRHRLEPAPSRRRRWRRATCWLSESARARRHSDVPHHHRAHRRPSATTGYARQLGRHRWTSSDFFGDRRRPATCAPKGSGCGGGLVVSGGGRGPSASTTSGGSPWGRGPRGSTGARG